MAGVGDDGGDAGGVSDSREEVGDRDKGEDDCDDCMSERGIITSAT